MGEFDLEVSERIAERTRDPILRAANAHIRDLEADRDSWRDQASERLKDWVDMRVRAETAEQRVRDLEQDAAMVLPLQRALATWLPSIAGQDSELGRLAADHALLLYGLVDDCTDCPGDRLHEDAMRYRWLRERDVDAIRNGGVFAGKTPDNVVLNGEDLDAAITAAMAASAKGGKDA